MSASGAAGSGFVPSPFQAEDRQRVGVEGALGGVAVGVLLLYLIGEGASAQAMPVARRLRGPLDLDSDEGGRGLPFAQKAPSRMGMPPGGDISAAAAGDDFGGGGGPLSDAGRGDGTFSGASAFSPDASPVPQQPLGMGSAQRGAAGGAPSSSGAGVPVGDTATPEICDTSSFATPEPEGPSTGGRSDAVEGLDGSGMDAPEPEQTADVPAGASFPSLSTDGSGNAGSGARQPVVISRRTEAPAEIVFNDEVSSPLAPPADLPALAVIVRTQPQVVAQSVEDAAAADSSGRQVGVEYSVLGISGPLDTVQIVSERLMSTLASTSADVSGLNQDLQNIGIDQSHLLLGEGQNVLQISVADVLQVVQESGADLVTDLNLLQAAVRDTVIGLGQDNDWINLEAGFNLLFDGLIPESADLRQTFNFQSYGLLNTDPAARAHLDLGEGSNQVSVDVGMASLSPGQTPIGMAYQRFDPSPEPQLDRATDSAVADVEEESAANEEVPADVAEAAVGSEGIAGAEQSAEAVGEEPNEVEADGAFDVAPAAVADVEEESAANEEVPADLVEAAVGSEGIAGAERSAEAVGEEPNELEAGGDFDAAAVADVEEESAANEEVPADVAEAAVGSEGIAGAERSAEAVGEEPNELEAGGAFEAAAAAVADVEEESAANEEVPADVAEAAVGSEGIAGAERSAEAVGEEPNELEAGGDSDAAGAAVADVEEESTANEEVPADVAEAAVGSEGIAGAEQSAEAVGEEHNELEAGGDFEAAGAAVADVEEESAANEEVPADVAEAAVGSEGIAGAEQSAEAVGEEPKELEAGGDSDAAGAAVADVEEESAANEEVPADVAEAAVGSEGIAGAEQSAEAVGEEHNELEAGGAFEAAAAAVADVEEESAANEEVPADLVEAAVGSEGIAGAERSAEAVGEEPNELEAGGDSDAAGAAVADVEEESAANEEVPADVAEAAVGSEGIAGAERSAEAVGEEPNELEAGGDFDAAAVADVEEESAANEEVPADVAEAAVGSEGIAGAERSAEAVGEEPNELEAGGDSDAAGAAVADVEEESTANEEVPADVAEAAVGSEGIAGAEQSAEAVGEEPNELEAGGDFDAAAVADVEEESAAYEEVPADVAEAAVGSEGIAGAEQSAEAIGEEPNELEAGGDFDAAGAAVADVEEESAANEEVPADVAEAAVGSEGIAGAERSAEAVGEEPNELEAGGAFDVATPSNSSDLSLAPIVLLPAGWPEQSGMDSSVAAIHFDESAAVSLPSFYFHDGLPLDGVDVSLGTTDQMAPDQPSTLISDVELAEPISSKSLNASVFQNPGSEASLGVDFTASVIGVDGYDIESGSGDDHVSVEALIPDDLEAAIASLLLEKGVENPQVRIQARSLRDSSLDVGAGNDSVKLLGGIEDSLVQLGSGDDRLQVRGDIEDSAIVAGDGDDVVVISGRGDLSGKISGGLGIDRLSFYNRSERVDVRLESDWQLDLPGRARDGFSVSDYDYGHALDDVFTQEGFEIILGSPQADVISAKTSDLLVQGGDGDDWLLLNTSTSPDILGSNGLLVHGGSGMDTYLFHGWQEQSAPASLGLAHLDVSVLELMEGKERLATLDKAGKVAILSVSHDGANSPANTSLIPIGTIESLLSGMPIQNQHQLAIASDVGIGGALVLLDDQIDRRYSSLATFRFDQEDLVTWA